MNYVFFCFFVFFNFVNICSAMYIAYVLLISKNSLNQNYYFAEPLNTTELMLWVFNVGYIAYELTEMSFRVKAINIYN